MRIWVDADACPVVIKEILYRAATRVEVALVLVANRLLKVPPDFAFTDEMAEHAAWARAWYAAHGRPWLQAAAVRDCAVADGVTVIGGQPLTSRELARRFQHAHGAIGGYQSRWTVRKSDLAVTSGSDLIQRVYNWDKTTQSSMTSSSAIAFNRLCSADLPKQSALYNALTGRGSQEKIFLAGDESGSNGYAIATVATGASAGNAYVLGKMNFRDNGSGGTAVGGWENLA